MREVFWLEPNRLGGRPGPNKEPWSLDTFRESGISLVVSLTERMYNASSQFAPYGIDHVCIALPKNAPPKRGDATEIGYLLPCVFEIVTRHLETPNRRVIVHCSSGKDRTGLFFCYYMMRSNGLSLGAAVSAVRSILPRLLSADGWDRMGRHILTKLCAESE